MTQIPLHEIEFTYARSSGPGGQNVNKTNTKVVLRWNVLATQAFSSEQKERLVRALAPRLTREGDLVISSDRTREQARNRSDCLEKLSEILIRALTPRRARRKTKPTRASKERRREAKSHRSKVKALRRGV